ncbi:hypothetical protein B9Z55_022890 [Caenorhabditis nigoni]|uniref:Uncharacterized protein n=1 Tax=Caenorhabditis nigoni TaxID=1611254 RepID=A0A2G5SMB5_9PELO|nr:hypothetical protein B9Z55_022890 [Caenorhabditis nigoni]
MVGLQILHRVQAVNNKSRLLVIWILVFVDEEHKEELVDSILSLEDCDGPILITNLQPPIGLRFDPAVPPESHSACPPSS